MIKVSIFKNGKQTHGASFSTQEEANAWIDLCKNKPSKPWGLPERPELDEQGNPTGNILPSEYEIQIEDISIQIEQEKQKEAAKKLLAETDWLVIRQLDSGVPMPEEIKQARAEARLKL